MTSNNPAICLGLDKNQQKLFIEFYYKSLPEKPSTTIRFFDRSEYYTVHGVDAFVVGKCISKTESIKYMDGGGGHNGGGDEKSDLAYLVVSKATFPVVARELLLVKKYRVEVYVKKGSKTEFILSYKGSPGNLLQFEEVLFGNLDTMAGSSLLSVQLKAGGSSRQKLVCLAFIDCLQQDLAVAEILDDDNLTEFEAFVVLLAPKEALLPSKENEYADIYKILSRNNILVTLRKKSDFQGEVSNVIDDLNHLLKFDKGQQKNAYTLVGDSNDSALLSLGAAIKYLELSGDESCWSQFHIRRMDLKRFVQMDSSAIAALNILPSPGSNPNSSASKYQSLLGVLDRCRTPQGHRLMAQWVVQPLRDVDMIRDRHNIVECLIDASHVRTLLHEDYLKRFPDIMVLCKKLMRKRAALQDIYRLYQVVVRSLNVQTILEEMENVTVDTNLCAPLKELRVEFTKFKNMVEQILDMDAISKNEYLIRSDFDDNLKEIKTEMKAAEKEMQTLLKRVTDDLDLETGTIKLDYTNQDGHFFKMTRKNDNVLRKNKNFKILDTTKSGVKFTNNRLGDLNEKYGFAQSSYQAKQQEIVDEIIQVAQGYVDSFSTLSGLIAELDCFVSFAVVAVSAPIPYVRPKITESSPADGRRIQLKDLRHPFIELQDDMNFIPNDVDFQENSSQMYLITGPNMGGKSTYIRSVGCAVAMALMGSFVPCSEATISLVDRIFGRVGACDDIGKGLSTFMKEMVETAGILRNATKDSLVIIDELGRGTSTYEGCGLAWAIAEHLASTSHSFTLFATHFHEITALAETSPAVKNYYMVAHADENAFTLLYQLKPGVTDKSFGIHVAKLVKFPTATIATAEETYKNIADHFSEMSENREKFKEITQDFNSVDLDNDKALERMIEEVHKNVQSVDKSFHDTLTKIGIQL